MPEFEFADHLAPANPCDVQIRSHGGLDRDPSLDGILDDGIVAVRHGHLQRDVGFCSCPVYEGHITIRDCGRQSSISAYSKGPNRRDLARYKSRRGC